MTEQEAQHWVQRTFGDVGLRAMQHVIDIVTAEAARQNLIAPSTLPLIWTRHIVDSAQLLGFASDDSGVWLDIGSGAGFPGLVIAALSERPVWLVEPRRRRAEFLLAATIALGVEGHTHVVCSQAQAVQVPASVVSARAVAPLGDIFDWASGCASSTTLWILPKGRSARDELVVTEQAWRGVFHVEHSITDPESLIVLASEVARRCT